MHKEGESFERRDVVTGPTFYQYATIIGGIDIGERVVTQGGYQVKLASASEAVGHGHTH